MKNEHSEESQTGMSLLQLAELGFDYYTNHQLGSEFNAIATPEIIEALEKAGLEKTWGHEGTTVSYAVYKCDNKEHPDFGKNIVSVYSDEKQGQNEIISFEQMKYVLDSIKCLSEDKEGYEIDISDNFTTKGKLQYVADCLKKEAFHSYNEKIFKGDESAIIEKHLRGLPHFLDLDYDSEVILNIGKKWGVDLSTEKKESEFIENWFESNIKTLLNLMDKKGVDVRADNSIFEKKISSLTVDECLQKIEEKEAKQKIKTPSL